MARERIERSLCLLVNFDSAARELPTQGGTIRKEMASAARKLLREMEEHFNKLQTKALRLNHELPNQTPTFLA